MPPPRPLILRPAQAEDLPRLGALKFESAMAWGDLPEAVRSLPEAREVPAEHLASMIVAESGGDLAGFATVLRGEGNDAELEDIFVSPSAWRRGVGSALMAEAERRAAALGARALHVIANERARAFYEACGFEQIGVVQTDFEPAPEMRKRL